MGARWYTAERTKIKVDKPSNFLSVSVKLLSNHKYRGVASTNLHHCVAMYLVPLRTVSPECLLARCAWFSFSMWVNHKTPLPASGFICTRGQPECDASRNDCIHSFRGHNIMESYIFRDILDAYLSTYDLDDGIDVCIDVIKAMDGRSASISYL